MRYFIGFILLIIIEGIGVLLFGPSGAFVGLAIAAGLYVIIIITGFIASK